MKIKQTVIALTLASALAIGAGAALAQDDTTPPTTEETRPGFRGPRGGFGDGHGPRGHFRGGPRGGFGGGVAAELIQEYTGLERDEIREAHQNGQTLADMIEANGQSVDDFIAAAMAAASERIDEAVANDRMTETVAAEMKTRLEERLTALVNGERPNRMPPVPAEDADA